MFAHFELMEQVYSQISTFFRGLLDLCCPPVCPLCQSLREDNAPFCADCTEKLATPPDQFCVRCGGRRFKRLKNKEGCGRCRTTSFRFQRAVTLGEYEKELRLLVLQAKTDRSGILATAAASLLAQVRAHDFREMALDLVLPVPMYRLRRWQRGVNSPDFIAAELAMRLNLPILSGVLRRIRPTELQYTLSANGRQENVAGAFDLKRPNSAAGKMIAGKRVLLVDDILTTAATVNEIASLLKRHGAAEVFVAALARAEGMYAQAAVGKRELIVENGKNKSGLPVRK